MPLEENSDPKDPNPNPNPGPKSNETVGLDSAFVEDFVQVKSELSEVREYLKRFEDIDLSKLAVPKDIKSSENEISARYAREVTELKAQLKSSQSKLEKYKELSSASEATARQATHKMRMVQLQTDVHTAALNIGVAPEAVRDVIALAKDTFKVCEDGEMRPHTKSGTPVLNEDGKEMDVVGWVKMEAKQSLHWFGRSAGGGAAGGENIGLGGLDEFTIPTSKIKDQQFVDRIKKNARKAGILHSYMVD